MSNIIKEMGLGNLHQQKFSKKLSLPVEHFLTIVTTNTYTLFVNLLNDVL